MKRIFAFICFVCVFSFFVLLSGGEKEITVSAVGNGATKQDALHDAMKKAIIKAVGVYANTKSTLDEKGYKEKIVLTSDATVTNYQEISAKEQDGIWAVKIRAKILPNELMKYCPKLVTQKVTSTDIGNLVSKLDALKSADSALDEIFKDYYLNIFRFRKSGPPRIVSADDLKNKNIVLAIDFIASIDQKAFDKFQSQLCALLDKMCLQKVSIKVGNTAKKKGILPEIPNDLAQKMWQKAGLKPFDVEKNEHRLIAFKKFRKGILYFDMYLVPASLYSQIWKKINWEDTYLICSFSKRDTAETKKYFFDVERLRFYEGEESCCIEFFIDEYRFSP